MKQTPKPSLVLLHGWSKTGIATWTNNERYLTQAGYRCISIKLPGFDLPEPASPWGVGDYAEYVLSKLKELNLTPPYIFVGHSFGGRLCIYIAAKYPEIVDKLVLTDAAGVANRKTPRLIVINVLSKVFKFMDRINGVNVLSNALRKRIFSNTASSDYKRATPMMREILKKVVSLDLKPNLKHIKAMTLVIWGELDDVTTLDEAHILEKGIMDSTLVLIKNAGHHAHFTHAQEWNEQVVTFLKS